MEEGGLPKQDEPLGRDVVLGYFHRHGHHGSPLKKEGLSNKEAMGSERDLVIGTINRLIEGGVWSVTRRPMVLASGQPHMWWFMKHGAKLVMEEPHLLLPSMQEWVEGREADERTKPLALMPTHTIMEFVVGVLGSLGEIMLPSAFHPHDKHGNPPPIPPAYLGHISLEAWPKLWPWLMPLFKERDNNIEEGIEEVVPLCMVASTRLSSGGIKRKGGGDVTHDYIEVLLGNVRAPNPDRPGQHKYKPIIERAHRLVTWAMLGPFEEGDWGQGLGPIVMHRCRNRACLHPHHLLVGSYGENNHGKGEGTYLGAMKRRKDKSKAMMEGG